MRLRESRGRHMAAVGPEPLMEEAVHSPAVAGRWDLLQPCTGGQETAYTQQNASLD